jgi:hypothetical protein
MSKSMAALGSYLVLVFFAAQFVAAFNWTNLGLILAVKGADLLRQLALGPLPLMVAFVLLTAALNLFMGSASAKWASMASPSDSQVMAKNPNSSLSSGRERLAANAGNPGRPTPATAASQTW